jgi:hypothetical protein
MRQPLSRLLLAGGLVATVLVAGHSLTSGTPGELGSAAGSILAGPFGHGTTSSGAGHGSAKGGSSSAAGASGAAGSADSGQSKSAGLTGITTAPDVNTGLLMRSPSLPPANLDEYVDGYIIEAAWNAIEPTEGSFVTSRIDSAVAAVRKWNAANPSNPRGLRLRITAGYDTPAWALNLGGPAMHLCSQSGSCGLVPRWWTAPVEAAYAAFTQKLAAYVNPTPEIREVTVGLTMVRYGEVMVRFPTVAGNAAAYSAAGYTEALDIAAMKAEINDGKAFSAVTQVDVADYQTPSNGQDISVSQEIMNYAVATLPHVQFANASITQSPGQNAAIFSLMQTYGPHGSKTASITFQTFPTLSSVTETLARAVSYGACSVEMPQSGVTPQIAVTYDVQLRDNCTSEGIQVPATPPLGQSNGGDQALNLTAVHFGDNWGGDHLTLTASHLGVDWGDNWGGENLTLTAVHFGDNWGGDNLTLTEAHLGKNWGDNWGGVDLTQTD